MTDGSLTRPRRYQLRRTAADVVRRYHPWIFRGQLSSAAGVFRDGQWLALHDHENKIIGTGMYEAAGAIGIRVLEASDRRPDAAWVAERVDAALARREPLRGETDAFRAIHGENDRLPAVVVDVYADTAVLLTYAAGAEALGRLAAAIVQRRLGLANVLWRPGHRRAGGGEAAGERAVRALRGRLPDQPIGFREGALALRVDPAAGQKGGGYLDLRGLRRWVAGEDLAGQRVLNLFSYTGTLGLAAERAGAAEVWNVDASRAALDFGARHHAGAGRQRAIEADVFDWLPALSIDERFDLVVCDPPPMTSRATQADRALRAYHKLYQAAARHVAPGGRLVACCCTSRVEPRAFRTTVAAALGDGFRFVRRIRHEPDHPVHFPEGDYLKVLVFERAG